MKKLILTHFLLNLYLLALLQPALPVLDYVINYDYIVSELCENRDRPILACNGKCYLGDQVEKKLELDRDQQLPLPPKIEYEKFTGPETEILLEAPQTNKIYLETPGTSSDLKDNLLVAMLLRPPIV